MTTPKNLVQTVTHRETTDGREIFVDDIRLHKPRARGFGATIQIRTEKVMEIFGRIPKTLDVIILEEI